MTAAGSKSKIERLWDALWSGGFSNPLRVLEQMSYLPPFAERRSLENGMKAIEAERLTVQRALAVDDQLSASLQSRARRGEL